MRALTFDMSRAPNGRGSNMKMDFQAIVDGISAMCCVVSVEKLPDDKYGKLRIVTGNRAYIDSIENPAPGTQMLTDKFTPNTEYTDYLNRDLNFESYCYNAAVKRKCLHSYANPERMPVWFNMTFLPIGEDDGDLCYCLYIMEINFEASSEMLSNTSADVATAVLDTCIRLRGTNDFKATMQDVIAGIRDLCDAEHCCILLTNDLDRSCQVLGEAFSSETKLLPMATYVDNNFYDIADSWKNTIAGSNCLIARDEQDMQVVKERNPEWYKSLTSAGAYNIVLFPLKSRNQLLGYMWAINFDKERAIKIKETLEVSTFIIGSELGNHLLLDRLRFLSSKDMLTGVMNRNEMNNYVDSLCQSGDGEPTSVGVIFADLNGLKAINDLEGHSAGDRMLKNAASVLRKEFPEHHIFRAGGDEFSIIVTGIKEAELTDKIEKIRQGCELYDNVAFAIGGSVEADSRNVRIALRRADEAMYEDKREFYEKHPERAAENRGGRSDREETDVEFRERSIYQDMNYDHLTKLPSMTYFFKLAEEGRRQMHEQNIDSVLLFINLSGMKYYNKKYGFAEGDALLKDMADIIADRFGKNCCSRFGQDHFAVYTKADGIENELKALFNEVKTANGGNSLPLRVGIYPDSMGVVEASYACDRAKYAASIKSDNRDSHFRYFDSKMLARENNRQYIVDNIDRAINENWVTAFYQPIVRATSGRVCDEEALARWIDPEKGMLSPADFIPILEDTKLIYKVDLHIVDVIIERMKKQMGVGLLVVPISVNLSRADFEMCDIVEEITNRLDSADIPRDMLTIEITESIVGENFDYMKEQVERFQKLGFKVWMDDFGSGYSSLDVLQEIQFDLIKFDMRFMRQFESNPKSRVILTELMRMASSLGIETVTEGVETAEQVQFLREIGSTRLQGYYFCKPIPFDEVLNRYETGRQIGFEDADEAEYNKVIGAINLYDLGSISSEDPESVKQYFNTMPMAILENVGDMVNLARCNKSYRELLIRYFGKEEVEKNEFQMSRDQGFGSELVNAIIKCNKVGQRAFINEETPDGDQLNTLIRKIADNPVNGKAAHAVAIIGIIPKSEQTITFTSVARALSADYIDLYHVDLDTDGYVQFTPESGNSDLTVAKKGKDFFGVSRKDAMKYIYKDDRDRFLEAFTSENIQKSIREHGAFTLSYRLLMDGEPKYVNMKAVMMNETFNQIIISVNNVDAQMRQQETIERLKEEATTYSRISVLMGDFIAIYTVDPGTGGYMQYSAQKEYADLGTSKLGMDFFADSHKEITAVVHPDDLEHVMSELTMENVLKKTKNHKVFILRYRLKLGEEYVPITLRAGQVEEKDGVQIIVGVSRTDESR